MIICLFSGKNGQIVTFFFASCFSDRKVFLSKGKLKCAGSSLFLKKKWGIGYHLRYRHQRRLGRKEKLATVRHDPCSKTLQHGRKYFTIAHRCLYIHIHIFLLRCLCVYIHICMLYGERKCIYKRY